MAKLVYNIEPASPSMISSLDRHCLTRVPDGSSNIVTERSHLNRILEGDERGLTQSLKNLYEGGVQKPTAQSEKPYLRIVLSASAEYFRPDDPEATGTWDEGRLAAWIKASMAQLREEHGADLIFAELHLDEDTPHIHAVVAPTYAKKPRKPGRPKRGETPEQFEERKALALASMGVRTVGRASHATLSKQDSFQRLRERMTVAVDHLGIEYGEDRAVDAPAGMSTREWVIQKAAELRAKQTQLEQRERELEAEKAAHTAKVKQDNKQLDIEWSVLEAEQLDVKDRESDLGQDRKTLAEERSALEKTTEWVERGVQNLHIAIDHAQAGTYDKEITLQDMPDKPKEFAVLKAAAPDTRPTYGFQAGFWSLNYSNSGKPVDLPEKIRAHLAKAFDRVATWVGEIRKDRQEARNALTEAQRSATEVAERIVASAEEDAAQILQEADQRGEELASVEPRIVGWRAFNQLVNDKLSSVFEAKDLWKVKKLVDEEWETHPDNPNPPVAEVKPVKPDPSAGPGF